MRAWELKTGTKIYRILSGRSNAYLIKTANLNLLVDTSSASNRIKLSNKLQAFGIEKLDWLLLTHTHFDHCQNAAWLQETFKCKIAISQHAQNSIETGNTRLPKGTNPLSNTIVVVGNKLNPKQHRYNPFNVEIFIQKEHLITDKNSTIKLIPTPGHSDDSISIIVDNEIALVGDTLFGIFRNSIFPPFANNPEMMFKQWNKLAQTKCNYFLPGHGKAVPLYLVESEIQKRKKA